MDSDRPIPPGESLPYATASLRPRRQIFSTVTFAALLMPMLLLSIILGPMAKRFEVIFLDFNTAIPHLSVLLLDLGKLFRRGGWVGVWVVALGIPFAIAPLLSGDPKRRRIYARVVLALSIIATVILLILAIIALFMPLIADINVLSGK